MGNEITQVETRHGYKVGQVAYVVPNDYNEVLKGIVTGFQKVGDFLPIIECNHPFNKGEKFKNAYSLNRISKTKTVTVVEWKLVNVKYKYDGE